MSWVLFDFRPIPRKQQHSRQPFTSPLICRARSTDPARYTCMRPSLQYPLCAYFALQLLQMALVPLMAACLAATMCPCPVHSVRGFLLPVSPTFMNVGMCICAILCSLPRVPFFLPAAESQSEKNLSDVGSFGASHNVTVLSYDLV